MSFTKEEAHALARVQIAMWVDGDTRCAECGHIYESVDDFLERNPRAAVKFPAPRTGFVDSACWSPKWDAIVAKEPRNRARGIANERWAD